MFLRGGLKSRELSNDLIVLAPSRRYRKQLLFAIGGVVAVVLLGLAIRHFELNYIPDPRILEREGEARALYTDREALRAEYEALRTANEALRRNNEELAAANQQFQAANAEIRTSLEKAWMDIEIGAGTRAELERQIAALNDQLKQANEELEFVKSARKKP